LKEGQEQHTLVVMTATIRRATPADADAVTSVLWASRRQAMPWLAERYTEAQARDWVGRVLLVTAMAWVAVEAGRIVGYAALEDDVLGQLYIAPDFQRQGIGARLLAIARDAAGSRMSLFVFARNAGARRFYERHGFTAAEESDGSRNEEGEPDVRYEWRSAKSR